ncbi:MAG: PilZ domain-containing protein [Bdellovibrionia bacterium]
MKDRILVVGRLNPESLAIQKSLKEDGQFDVSLVTRAPDAMDTITRQNIDLMIMNLQNFTKAKVQLASDLRSLGYGFPVLVLAHIIAADTYKIVSDIPNTILLEKPYEIKDLTGISEKLIDGRNVRQRIFRRYQTNETAELELFKNGQAISGKLRDLSRGGAFVEYSGPDLVTGDMLRMNIDLKQVARRYEVNAKVVWTTRKSPWGEEPGVGVEFIKQRDYYQNLLRKM